MGAAAGRTRLNPAAAAPGTGTARTYAQRLLDSLGITAARPLDLTDEHPAIAWARSGLMTLTGHADGPPLMCPVPLTACAEGALAALKALAPSGTLDELDAAQLLVERAAISGFSRRGTISAGGSSRLLQTKDGWIALNLAREDDWALLPAWLDFDVVRDWNALAEAIRKKTMHDCVERGRLLGLAVVPGVPPQSKPAAWCTSAMVLEITRPSNSHSRAPLVVDLSSLWAGPLCSHLLQRCGARVVKVESRQRPDGARAGSPAFFERLNSAKESLILDFSRPEGIAKLRSLLLRADIVIEASRPRALYQLGISAEEILHENPCLTWLSLTGYGRHEPQAQWIAYGDDAAVAAGLTWVMRRASDQTVFVGDAIADPLTGLHAALAGWASWLGGGGRLISLALRDVVTHCIQADLPDSVAALQARYRDWTDLARQQTRC